VHILLPEQATGVILAGGSARRFGAEKALALVGGETIVRRVHRALASVFPEVIVIGGSEAVRLVLAGVPAFDDDQPGSGPLGGLSTALRVMSTPYAFCVGCDMPFLAPDLIEEVTRLVGTADAAAPRCQGRVEPLHACYHARCREVAGELLAQGERRMTALLEAVNTTYLEIAPDDHRRRSLDSVNTVEDLLDAQRRCDCAR
jgi:molybdopterin-guanine dinucleotide biosynthesis protein A